MPAAAQTGHRLIDDMAIPYVTFDSPVADTPAFEDGLNILTSMRRVLERRPGFATPVEASVTNLPGTINNIFTWRRWSSSFFVMLSIAANGHSQVWKLELGVDASFSLLLDIPGTTEPFSFIARNNFCFMGCGVAGSMQKFGGRGAQGENWITGWGIAAPTWKPVCTAVAVGAGLNGINCQVDYHYRCTYCHELVGGESSPSDLNECIGQFTNSGVQVQLKASPDPQVGHIRVYRSRDGGSTDPQQMQEIVGSPFLNADQTITDRTEDADLHNRFAPGLLRNDPPPPMKGFQSHSSRIFGFADNVVWFSGFDEIVNGMMEECFPGASIGPIASNSGNWYPFDDEISALAQIAGDAPGMAVFIPGSVSKIDGAIRNEMTRYTIDELHGARSPQAVRGLGSDVAWVDTAAQIRLSSVGEMSTDIRPDAAKINPSNAMVVAHVSGTKQWVCVLDTITGILYVLDMDLKIWMVPWKIGASAIWSGEIAPGKRVLMAAINNQVWYMTDGKFNDAGQSYAAFGKTNLIPLSPQNNPDEVQTLDAVSIERDRNNVSDIRVLVDENTSLDSAYKTIFLKENESDPSMRAAGKVLIEKRYTIPPDQFSPARRGSVRIDWPAVDAPFELYSINVEIHPVSGEQ